MTDEKTKGDIKNPNFYSGSTSIRDWTGITPNNGGGFSIDYEIYSKRPGVQKTDEAIENLAISLGLKKPYTK